MKALWIAALAALSGPALAQVSAPAGDAKHGQALFMQEGCYACHGTAGHGEPYGPRLAPKPLPWVAVIAQVRHPRASMPPYTAQALPDQDLADIYAYLAAIPAGRSAKDIPLLRE
jgi:mono/diheme cytochrome c family protein